MEVIFYFCNYIFLNTDNGQKSFLQNYLKSTTKATFGVSALQGIQAEINNPNSTLNQGIGLMTWHGLNEVKAYTDLDETYRDNIKFLNLVGLSHYVSPNPPTN